MSIENMEHAKHEIIEYCMEEFGSRSDFSDLEAVPLGDTELYDENDNPHHVEIKADLIHPCIYWILDGVEGREKDYPTLSDLAKYISKITFSDLCWEVEF